MLYKSFVLILSFLLMSFSFFKMTPVEYAAKECVKVSSFLCKKLEMVQIGAGGSAPNGIINYETLFFKKNGHYSISEARKILLESAEVYLKAMNSCDKIRHAMVKYPFDEKNCYIGIFFNNPDGSNPLFPNISYACINNGELIYRAYKDPKNRMHTEVEFIESYQEALERAKKE